MCWRRGRCHWTVRALHDDSEGMAATRARLLTCLVACCMIPLAQRQASAPTAADAAPAQQSTARPSGCGRVLVQMWPVPAQMWPVPAQVCLGRRAANRTERRGKWRCAHQVSPHSRREYVRQRVAESDSLGFHLRQAAEIAATVCPAPSSSLPSESTSHPSPIAGSVNRSATRSASWGSALEPECTQACT